MQDFCSAIDFGSIPIMPKQVHSRKWVENYETVQNCVEAVHKGDRAKDLISFVGYEWTQINPDNKDDYGHKCLGFVCLWLVGCYYYVSSRKRL